MKFALIALGLLATTGVVYAVRLLVGMVGEQAVDGDTNRSFNADFLLP